MPWVGLVFEAARINPNNSVEASDLVQVVNGFSQSAPEFEIEKLGKACFILVKRFFFVPTAVESFP